MKLLCVSFCLTFSMLQHFSKGFNLLSRNSLLVSFFNKYTQIYYYKATEQHCCSSFLFFPFSNIYYWLSSGRWFAGVKRACQSYKICGCSNTEMFLPSRTCQYKLLLFWGICNFHSFLMLLPANLVVPLSKEVVSLS